MRKTQKRQAKAHAFAVRLSSSGKLQWIEHDEGHLVCHDTEPGASIWRRALIRLLAALPIEWLL